MSEPGGSPIAAADSGVHICPGCSSQNWAGTRAVCCDGCDRWVHFRCAGIRTEPSTDQWFCPDCGGDALEEGGEGVSYNFISVTGHGVGTLVRLLGLFVFQFPYEEVQAVRTFSFLSGGGCRKLYLDSRRVDRLRLAQRLFWSTASLPPIRLLIFYQGRLL